MVVHASGCASLLLFILLYGVDAYLPGQLDRNPADVAISVAPKPQSQRYDRET